MFLCQPACIKMEQGLKCLLLFFANLHPMREMTKINILSCNKQIRDVRGNKRFYPKNISNIRLIRCLNYRSIAFVLYFILFLCCWTDRNIPTHTCCFIFSNRGFLHKSQIWTQKVFIYLKCRFNTKLPRFVGYTSN